MRVTHGQITSDRRRQAVIAVLVALLHLLMLYWFAMMRGSLSPPELTVPAVDVTLFDFAGGGGSSAGDEAAENPKTLAARSSALHVPSEPRPWEDPLLALTTEAPQDLTVTSGMMTVTGPIQTQAEPSFQIPADAPTGSTGQGSGTGGGSGDGNGTGVGSGSGPGNGWGSGPILIRGPAGATISQNISAESLAAMKGGYGLLRCEIRLDQRLDRCRVLRESPAGSGHGQLALGRAEEFRFRPPYRAGRFRGSHRITVAIAFPPPAQMVEQNP